MTLLDQLMQKIRGLLTTELSGITPPQQRALHIEQIFDQLRMWSYENYEAGYLTNFYIDDDGSMWAIFDKMGVLYRSSVTVADGRVAVGELQEVTVNYTPTGATQERSFVLRREADGSIHFAGIACTAVVNRAGEIDSTTLFDNMVRFAEETGYYPAVDFYHTGDLEPKALHFGQVTALAREGIAYLVAGTLDPEHPLTRAILEAYEKGDEKWGFSIEYYPFADSEQEIEVGNKAFRMYTNGINTRISILKERDACSQFTALAVQRMEAMNETQRQKFIEVLGEAETEKLLKAANLRTKEADEAGMVYRNAEEQPPEPSTDGDGTPATEQQRTAEIELDDATLDEIAKRVAALMGDKTGEQVAQVNGVVEKTSTDVAELTRQLTKLRSRLDEFEAKVEEGIGQMVADMPASSKLRITHRPRTARAEQAPEPEQPTVIKPGDLAQRAESALKTLKRA